MQGLILQGDYVHYDLFEGFVRNYSLLEKFGKNVFDGLRLVNKMIVTHACQYRIRRNEDGTYYRTPYDKQYKDYLKTISILNKNKINYETISNNEALLVENENYRKLSYDWSKFPIKKLELTEHEKELQKKVMKK